MLNRRLFLVSSSTALLCVYESNLVAFAQTIDEIANPELQTTSSNFISRHFKNAIIREEVNIDLAPPQLQGASQPTFLWADTVRLTTGEYRTSGQSFGIVARELILDNKVKIITSGKFENVKNFKASQKPAPPAEYGEQGIDGEAGGEGLSGGAIYIYAHKITGKLILDTSGTPGGNGQTGGDGAIGKNGSKGRSCRNGRNGGPGGNGGVGGNGGDGGNGGNIYVSTASKNHEKIKVSALDGGNGGRFGINGKPARGGAGGRGGKRKWRNHDHPEDNRGNMR